MKNNMSIKKGKKQVYKVGDRVKVIVCAGGNPSHLGKTGTYKGTTFDETYPVIEIGKDDFCNPKKLSPLKPKKSKVEKWFKVEYMTTLKPPKTLFEAHGDRYYPIGNGKPFKVDELRVYKVSSSN